MVKLGSYTTHYYGTWKLHECCLALHGTTSTPQMSKKLHEDVLYIFMYTSISVVISTRMVIETGRVDSEIAAACA